MTNLHRIIITLLFVAPLCRINTSAQLPNVAGNASSYGGYSPSSAVRGQQMTTDQLAGQVNTVTTAMSFMTISPESRGGAMGDVGAATSPDINSQHWNIAKYAFVKSDMGAALSYTPWLRELVDDISLSYLVGYKRIDQKQVVSASLRYFSLGNITFTNIHGGTIDDYSPNEFAIDLGYALKLSENISGGIGMRYLYSNLTGGHSSDGVETHPAQSVAADISMFYSSPKIKIADKKANVGFGVSISNIGNKVSYTDENEKTFIPTNLKIGTAFTIDVDAYNSITIAADINKLLVPTPEVQANDTTYGKLSDVSVAKGIFQSFSDAPGKMKEELHEVMWSAGLEYWYAKQFALRAGYFHEHELKGNRKYFTVGIGLKLNVFGLNFSYLMPTQQNNPLQNTVRFSLLFDFESLKNKDKGEDPANFAD